MRNGKEDDCTKMIKNRYGFVVFCKQIYDTMEDEKWHSADWNHTVVDKDGLLRYANRLVMARNLIQAKLAEDVNNHQATPVEVDITGALTNNVYLYLNKNTQKGFLCVSRHYLWKKQTTLDTVEDDIIPDRVSLRLGWPHTSLPTKNRCDNAQWIQLARSLGWKGLTDAKGQQCHKPHTHKKGSIHCNRCGKGPDGGRYRVSKKWTGDCDCGGKFEQNDDDDDDDDDDAHTHTKTPKTNCNQHDNLTLSDSDSSPDYLKPSNQKRRRLEKVRNKNTITDKDNTTKPFILQYKKENEEEDNDADDESQTQQLIADDESQTQQLIADDDDDTVGSPSLL